MIDFNARWHTVQLRTTNYWSRLPLASRGALLMLASAFLFVVMSSLVKFLGDRLHPFQIAFFRALTSFLIILPFVMREGAWGFRTRQPVLHVLRGIAGTSAMLCGFYAFTYLPLADATAISFARALFLVPLALMFLGETVGINRWAATLIGFAGVLLVLRPSGTTDPTAFVAVAHAVFVALAVICVKLLSRTDGPLTLLLYSGFIGTILSAIPAFLLWTTPTWEELGLLALMGAVGTLAHNCFVRAYAVADATALAPLDYTRLIFATLIGFLIFSDLPDWWTVAGALIIAGASLYITVREAQKAGDAKS